MNLAIVMVTYNSAAALSETLQANHAVAEALDAPIVVADNDSADETVSLLNGFPSVEVVRMHTNLGYAAGVNAALAAAPGCDTLLVNPDVEIPGADAVRALVAGMETRDRAAIVAPSLVDDNGTRQQSARRFPSLAAMVSSLPVLRDSGWGSRTYERYVAPSTALSATTTDWVIGAAMLLRRRAFDELDGWDEHFFLYMEDADYCRRCWRAGWQVWLEPSVAFRHGYRRESTALGSSILSSPARRRHVVSLARFFAREPSLTLGRRRDGQSS